MNPTTKKVLEVLAGAALRGVATELRTAAEQSELYHRATSKDVNEAPAPLASRRELEQGSEEWFASVWSRRRGR